MEDSRTSHNHSMQFMLQTVLGYMLQRPIPVVIVVFAEVVSTRQDLRPRAPIKGHPHVVLAAYPRRYFHLKPLQSSATSLRVYLFSPHANNANSHMRHRIRQYLLRNHNYLLIYYSYYSRINKRKCIITPRVMSFNTHSPASVRELV